MQRTSLRLHTLFASLLPGLVLAQAACGGTTSGTSSGTVDLDGGSVDGGPRDPVFETLPEKVCLSPAESLYGFPKDATLATGVDYIGGYALNRSEGDAGTPIYELRLPAALTTGEACKTAKNQPGCLADLVKNDEPGTKGSPGWSTCEGFCDFTPVQARVTRGDAVTVLKDAPESVVSAYLPIDTATEAAARVAASRMYGAVGCTAAGKDVLRETNGSYLVYARSSGNRCTSDSKFSIDYVHETIVRVAPDGTMSVVAKHDTESAPAPGCAVAGRRPEGLVSPSRDSSLISSNASFLSKMAHLEAASVVAFEQMASELRHHGAPSDLVARAEAARTDEVRHAETMSLLAKASGAHIPAVNIMKNRAGARSLFDMAIENVAEGCVRETFGALVAHRQAKTAHSTAMRFAMQTIARDETEHAALSWDLHTWLMTQLTDSERALVSDAFVRAARDLELECQAVESEEVRRSLGLPDAAESLELARGLIEQLELGVAA